jgi:DNA-directed RNA polymerase subunit K/omega
MDYKKTTAPTTTITRDMIKMGEETGNIYETVRIIGKRSNEIAVDIKHDLENKLHEFSSYSDSLEEIFENREQIEISRYFERLPKPTLIAAQEFIDHEVYYRNPLKEKDKLEEL